MVRRDQGKQIDKRGVKEREESELMFVVPPWSLMEVVKRNFRGTGVFVQTVFMTKGVLTPYVKTIPKKVENCSYIEGGYCTRDELRLETGFHKNLRSKDNCQMSVSTSTKDSVKS